MPFTPVTGLSLIVHLAIIGVAALFNLLGLRGGSQVFGTAIKTNVSTNVFLRTLKSAIALLILLSMFAFMVIFGTTAYTTAIREGAQEAHIQYLKALAIDLYTYEAEYRQVPTPYAPAAALQTHTSTPYTIPHLMLSNDLDLSI